MNFRYEVTQQSGFTLLELMIATTILAFISLAVYQNTTQSFLLRDSLERDGDFYNTLRVALDVLGRDLSHAYSPQKAAFPEVLAKKQPGEGQPSPGSGSLGSPEFWGDPVNAIGIRPARFQGEKSKISFVANNHIRLFRDSPESDLVLVSYALEDDPLPPPASKARDVLGKVLVKHEDPAVFEDNARSETDQKYVLLRNVKSIEFQFLDGTNDSLDSRWDTSGVAHKGAFPSAVQFTVEVYMPSRDPSKPSTFSITQLYRPELPL